VVAAVRQDGLALMPREFRLGAGVLVIPALAILLFLFALPLAILIGRSFWIDGSLSLGNYAAFLGDAYSWQVVVNTLSVALRVTLICLAVGYPVALLLVRLRGWLVALALATLVLPMSLNVIVKVFAWQILLRREGVVNKLLMHLQWIDAPLRILFTDTALILGSVNVFIPFMILPIYSVARQIDPNVCDAARTLGAGPVFVFSRVMVPLTMPGIVAGASFVFSMCISMYVIPVLLIGDRFQMLATQTARSFLTLGNHALGATTATVLLAIGFATLLATTLLVRETGQKS
jgi:putative spermidine/putrescine transport system permease protein